MNRGCKYSKFECCGGQIRLDHPLHSLEARSCCAGRAGHRRHNVSYREGVFECGGLSEVVLFVWSWVRWCRIPGSLPCERGSSKSPIVQTPHLRHADVAVWQVITNMDVFGTVFNQVLTDCDQVRLACCVGFSCPAHESWLSWQQS